MEGVGPFIPWVGGALALICVVAALRDYRRKRLIDDLPTSKTLGAFIGLVELNGTAESEKPLRSYLAEIPCVHYEWKAEEHWSRTTERTYTDKDGNTRTRTERESGWKDIGHGGQSQPFYLKDSQGVILVRPEGAELEPQTVLERTCTAADPLYYLKGPATAVPDSDERRRFTERAFRLHAPVFVVGKARERSDVVAAEIAHEAGAELFLISSHPEEKVSAGLGLTCWVWTGAGLVLLLASLILWDRMEVTDHATRVRMYVAAPLAYALAWLLGWAWVVFNSVISLRNRVAEGWGLVDIQLKRRHDLIPGFVRIVSALKDHESRVQAELTVLRGQLGATPPGKPGEDFRALRTTVTALQERYPVLKAYDAFQNLQRTLVETENRIALARDYYNRIATHCNTRLERMPEGLVAVLTGTKPRPLLAAQDFERAVVKVDLAR